MHGYWGNIKHIKKPHETNFRFIANTNPSMKKECLLDKEQFVKTVVIVTKAKEISAA